jgi:hypothetical protein
VPERHFPRAEERLRLQRGGLSYGWYLTSRARQLCPSLAARLKAPVPNDSNTTTLAIVMPAPGYPDGKVTVAVYTVRFGDSSARESAVCI